MKNLSLRTIKLLLGISITLFISLLMFMTYLHEKGTNGITRNQEILKNKEEKDRGEILSSVKHPHKRVLMEKVSREIIPEEEALQKDAVLNQEKIEPFKGKKIRDPDINIGNHHSTFGREVAFIYFSHNRESFLPYFKTGATPKEAYHSKLNVSLVGERLGKILKHNGIWNTVSDADIINMLKERNLNFVSSYLMSREVVQNELRRNRDLEMSFDIHRDAIPRNLSTIDIDGKSFAKISFVIGSAHKNYKSNLEFTNGINDVLEKNYPGLSRGVIIKNRKQGNGVYNQDLIPNSVIIEIGGVENNLEELYRTADVLGYVISQYYWNNVH